METKINLTQIKQSDTQFRGVQITPPNITDLE